jgi:hypothetical protein
MAGDKRQAARLERFLKGPWRIRWQETLLFRFPSEIVKEIVAIA